jgi:hypothetical protein
MLQTFKTFASDEAGAVTVDWVVLTAALVGLGLAVMGVVSSGIGNVSAQIETSLAKDHLAESMTGFTSGRTGYVPAGGNTPANQTPVDPTPVDPTPVQ